MATYINVHTHIFSVNHVPQYVVGQDRFPFGKFFSVENLSRINPAVFSMLELVFRKKKTRRLFTFAKLGLATQQSDQFKTLEKYYSSLGHDFRFVILPMDMEQMGAGETNSNLYTQLHDIIELRRNPEIAYRLIPFVPVDPRRPEFTTGNEILEFVKNYIVNFGFAGIKLYPALGYFPFDPKLFEMYEWAIQNNIPIMVHCIQGAIHWQGNMGNYNSILSQGNGTSFKTDVEWDKLSDDDKLKKREVFQRNFTQPQNYNVLIEELKKEGVQDAENLKICMGHFGMDDKTWFPECMNLVAKFPNFYADISYVIAEDELNPELNEVLKGEAQLQSKTLFGTDFFVVSKAKKEDEILNKYLGLKYPFAPFAEINAEKYLTSAFFKP